MRLKVIIVEPKYQMNLGYISRVAKNFGVKKLFFVSPRAKLTGKNATMYSKHSKELLRNAKVYRTFDDAISDCSMVIGTTGIKEKANATLKRVYLLQDAIKRVERTAKKGSTVGLVMGRDDIGLRSDEVEKCDVMAYISTNPEYPVLNISHALAICLYELTRSSFTNPGAGFFSREEKAERKEMLYLFSRFDSMVRSKGNIRNRRAVLNVFRRLVINAQPTKRELHALITALK